MFPPLRKFGSKVSFSSKNFFKLSLHSFIHLFTSAACSDEKRIHFAFSFNICFLMLFLCNTYAIRVSCGSYYAYYVMPMLLGLFYSAYAIPPRLFFFGYYSA